MVRRALPFLIVVASLAPRAAGAADRWIEVRTAHFRIHSDASTTRTAEIARSLETFRSVLAVSTNGIRLLPSDTATILVFKSDKAFTPYKPFRPNAGRRTLGYVADTPEGPRAALCATPPQNVDVARAFKRFQFSDAPIYHEFTHLLLRRTFSRLPTWLNEGIAEYFSTFVIHGGHAEVGRAARARLPALQRGFEIPLDRLMATSDFSGLRAHALDIAYAESWAVVHTLLRGTDERRSEFARFLTLLRQGVTQADAFRRAFPISAARLQAEAEAHVTRGSYPIDVYALSDLSIPEPGEPRRLTPLEVDLELGELAALVHTPHLDVAEARFRAALADKPDDPRALAGLGLVDERRGHDVAAEAHYRQALAASPGDPIASFRLGRLLAGQVGIELGPDPPKAPAPSKLLEARSLLETALAARPDITDADGAYGWTFLADPGGRSRGIATLQAALEAEPGRWRWAEGLAYLELWAGDRTGAAAELAVAGRSKTETSEHAALRDAILERDVRDIRASVAEEGAAAGVRRIDALIAATADGDLLRQLRAWRAKVEAASAAP